MLRWMTKEKNLIFVAGAATGLAVLGLLKTKKARKLAVKGVANGIMLKDRVLEGVSNIREEAGDICEQAKAMAKSECEETCECEKEA